MYVSARHYSVSLYRVCIFYKPKYLNMAKSKFDFCTYYCWPKCFWLILMQESHPLFVMGHPVLTDEGGRRKRAGTGGGGGGMACFIDVHLAGQLGI